MTKIRSHHNLASLRSLRKKPKHELEGMLARTEAMLQRLIKILNEQPKQR